VIAILVLVSGAFGLFMLGFYAEETLNWQSQSVGQDFINLTVIAPFLVCTAILAYNGNFYGSLLWAGTLVYLIYTYVIYCFNVHFNMFFIDYCIILGASFYSLLYFFYKQIKEPTSELKNLAISKVVAVYFILIGSLFSFLWLSEIIPSIRNNRTPESLEEVGLFTNPVHVLDLAIVLPGLIITGILIFRKNHLGYLMAPILLMFFILMDITIGALTLIMTIRGIETNMGVTFIMAVLAVLSFVLLISYKKVLKPEIGSAW
jgi:hypothetical protein